MRDRLLAALFDVFIRRAAAKIRGPWGSAGAQRRPHTRARRSAGDLRPGWER